MSTPRVLSHPMSIYERFRQHAGWTQTALADALGQTRAAVSMWEKGERTPKPETAHAFLAVCKANGFEATLYDIYPAPETEPAA